MHTKQTPRKLSAILQDAIDNYLEIGYEPDKASTLTAAISLAAKPWEHNESIKLLAVINELVPTVPFIENSADRVSYVLAYQYAMGIYDDWPNSRWFSHMFAMSVIEYLKSIGK